MSKINETVDKYLVTELSEKGLADAMNSQFGKKNWRIDKSGEVWVNAPLPGAPQIRKWWHYGDKQSNNLIKQKIPSSRLSGGYD